MDPGWLAWDKVERGRLFILPSAQCWVGPVTGQQCGLCEQPIQDATECEVAGPMARCSLISRAIRWAQESQVRRERPG